MRSSSRSREVVSRVSSSSSTSRQRRSGATGVRALQCGPPSAARASEKVGYARSGSPQAAAHRPPVVGSSSAAAASRITSRSKGLSPKQSTSASRVAGPRTAVSSGAPGAASTRSWDAGSSPSAAVGVLPSAPRSLRRRDAAALASASCRLGPCVVASARCSSASGTAVPARPLPAVAFTSCRTGPAAPAAAVRSSAPGSAPSARAAAAACG